jgi:radical SAM/Cys-rich protein
MESMGRSTIDDVIAYLASSNLHNLDLTGGAPELNPYFMDLVHSTQKMGVHVTDRCNLTILEESGMEGLGEFFADHQVEIIASLPCYLKENVDRQRGKGAFDASIRALRKLNQLGYGQKGSELILNLIYNPSGPFLPPPQRVLEEDYRGELNERYGIFFNHLYTITNMPIHRFENMLVSNGGLASYMKLLREAHRETNLLSVMCRRLISVDWRGYVYDCDFNQLTGLPLRLDGKSRVHLSELMGIDLEGSPIMVCDHCYGCTAGQGSSCNGVLADA